MVPHAEIPTGQADAANRDDAASRDGDAILKEAWSRLSANPQFQNRIDEIALTCNQGHLVIRGRVPSFYLKQLVQTLLGDVNGVITVENAVDVVASDGLSSTNPVHMPR